MVVSAAPRRPGAGPAGSTAVVSATVHGFTFGYGWAAGAFWAGAVLCGALIRGGTRLHHEAGRPEPVDQVVSGPI
ncbi:hypothetical protein M2271_005859 [Streptomyces sp. LBL]|uniref:hypothetical protein n=1 Tax=Streptomyces sp. LBL TaxID=2940562 RepID=UPI002473E647|nr:hypothetical protein [Streptomyces sp. LBL]MDH6628029.1 hypothetical protein [Streptomyces sp. LBL]